MVYKGGEKCCAVEALGLFVIYLSWLSILLSLSLVGTGIALAVHTTLYDAYGDDLVSHWKGLVSTGLLVIVPGMFCGLYAAKRHNKFWLLMYVLLFSFCVLYHSYVAALISGLMTPDYTDAQKTACVEYAPDAMQTNFSQTCADYFTDDRRTGFYRLWILRYTKTSEDLDALSWLQDIQGRGGCCGFGKPGGCWQGRLVLDEMEDIPYDMRKTVLDNGTGVVDLCGSPGPGARSNWYPPTSGETVGCDSLYQTNQGQMSGGCIYDLPVSQCDGKISKPGCAMYIEQAMTETLNSYWTCVVAYISMELLMIFTALCFCFKRKDMDVVPLDMRKWKAEPSQEGVDMIDWGGDDLDSREHNKNGPS